MFFEYFDEGRTSIPTFASIRWSSILITKNYCFEINLPMNLRFSMSLFTLTCVKRLIENLKCHALYFYSLFYSKHLTALISFFEQNIKTPPIWPVKDLRKWFFGKKSETLSFYNIKLPLKCDLRLTLWTKFLFDYMNNTQLSFFIFVFCILKLWKLIFDGN